MHLYITYNYFINVHMLETCGVFVKVADEHALETNVGVLGAMACEGVDIL